MCYCFSKKKLYMLQHYFLSHWEKQEYCSSKIDYLDCALYRLFFQFRYPSLKENLLADQKILVFLLLVHLQFVYILIYFDYSSFLFYYLEYSLTMVFTSFNATGILFDVFM